MEKTCYAYNTTNSGKKFYFHDVEKSYIDINDIAHALSHMNRFCGHTDFPYSVAQHSVLVYEALKQQGFESRLDILAHGLLHDASEAYLGDVTRPLKELLPEYKAIEDRVQKEIYKRLGMPALSEGALKIVDKYDEYVFRNEIGQVITSDVFEDYLVLREMKVEYINPIEAKRRYLKAYNELVERGAFIL
jgi:hypothetical protein